MSWDSGVAIGPIREVIGIPVVWRMFSVLGITVGRKWYEQEGNWRVLRWSSHWAPESIMSTFTHNIIMMIRQHLYQLMIQDARGGGGGGGVRSWSLDDFEETQGISINDDLYFTEVHRIPRKPARHTPTWLHRQDILQRHCNVRYLLQ